MECYLYGSLKPEKRKLPSQLTQNGLQRWHGNLFTCLNAVVLLLMTTIERVSVQKLQRPPKMLQLKFGTCAEVYSYTIGGIAFLNYPIGVCITVLSGHTASVTCLRWGGEGLIFTGSQDRTIKVYAAADVRQVTLLRS